MKEIILNEDIEQLIYETVFLNNGAQDMTPFDMRVLTEEYNMYDGLYDDVNFITNTIVNLIANGTFNMEYRIPYNGKTLKINEVAITLYTGDVEFDGSSEIVDNCLILEIHIGILLRHLDEGTIYDILSKNLEHILVHELTHAKNDSEVIKKYGEDKAPEWYRVAIESLVGPKKMDGIPYIFFHSLYLCFYSERQAFAAQIGNEVENKIKYNTSWESLNREGRIDLINALVTSNPQYRTYYFLKEWHLPMLKRMNQFDKDMIIHRFKEYGMNINDYDIEKFIKRISYGCDIAFAKIRRSRNRLFIKYNLV